MRLAVRWPKHVIIIINKPIPAPTTPPWLMAMMLLLLLMMMLANKAPFASLFTAKYYVYAGRGEAFRKLQWLGPAGRDGDPVCAICTLYVGPWQGWQLVLQVLLKLGKHKQRAKWIRDAALNCVCVCWLTMKFPLMRNGKCRRGRELKMWLADYGSA